MKKDDLAEDEMDSIRRFFLQYCEPPVRVTEDTLPSSARIVWTQRVDVMKLMIVCPEVAQQLLEQPMQCIDRLRVVSGSLSQSSEAIITPTSLCIRFTHFPPVLLNIPSIPPPQGRLVQLCGTVIRMSTKRVVPFSYRLMCPRCRQTSETFTTPFDRSCSTKITCDAPSCKREMMQVVNQVWMDYAECRLQQRSNVSGKLPRSILVTLDDELSGSVSVGQFVEVVGVLFPKWKQVFPSSRPLIEPTLWAINVTPMEAYRASSQGTLLGTSSSVNLIEGTSSLFIPELFFSSFKKRKLCRLVSLVRSTCPQLSGLFAPRLAILLATVGGAPLRGRASLQLRSTIHCLFVGDPSTGKSQLLRFVGQISPRSTCTTGMGSTSAGLTVAATKEEGEWVLEPGALVLSDGGACVIDELRTVAVADRTSLHEAMEQQTISVAKGGVVTKLRTNCAVIAACNPPVQRTRGGAGATSLGVGGPLLSRFDLIFLLWDRPQSDLDSKIADHILACSGTGRLKDDSGQGTPLLSGNELARYLCWVRGQYADVDGPKLGENAAKLLGCYFDILRARGMSPALDDDIPVTVRMLESLVRLTQAYGKLHLQSVCSIDDASMAVFLMERSAHGLKCSIGENLFSSSSCLDDVFLSDKEDDLKKQEEVLQSLVRVIFSYSSSSQPFGEPLDNSRVVADGVSEDLLTERRKCFRFVPRERNERFPRLATNNKPHESVSSHLSIDKQVHSTFSTGRSISIYEENSEGGWRSSISKEELLYNATQFTDENAVTPESNSPLPFHGSTDTDRKSSSGSRRDEIGSSSFTRGSQGALYSGASVPSFAHRAVSTLDLSSQTDSNEKKAFTEPKAKRKRTGSEIMESLRFRF